MMLNRLNHLVKEKGRQWTACLLLPLLLLLLGIPQLNAQDIILKDANTSTFEDSTFTITAEMQAGTVQVNAVELQLVFDPAFLEIVNVTPINAGFFQIVPNVVNNPAGTFTYFGGAFPPFPSGTFDFVEIEFLAKATGTTDIGFSTVSPTVVAGTGSGNILQSATGATVSISSPQCQPLTAQAPELCPADAGSFDLTSLEASITTQAGTFSYASGGNAINTPSSASVSNGQVVDVTFNGSNGCVATTTITFDVAAPVTGANFQITSATCGLNNGAITLIGGQGGLSGGISPFSFSLDGSDYSNTTGIYTNLDPNTYTFYIQDSRGCISTETVIVPDEVDATAPTALCNPDFTLALDAQTGTAAISIVDIDGGSSDNCGITNSFLSVNSFSCADLGPNVVTLTVEDGAGNSTTCTTTVTIDGSNVISPTTNVSATTCDPLLEGVDSTVLTNQFGCDSLVVVTTTLLQSDVVNESVAICQGETFDFNGQILSTAGNYQAVLTNQFGCDSTVNLTLSVNSVINTNEILRICDGDTVTFGSQQLTAAGIYSETFTSTGGCDSTVTLALFVDPIQTTTIAATICANETISFGGQQLGQAGTYTSTFTASTGCDSIVTLNLNVNPIFNESISETICANETFSFDGQALNTAGTYTATFPSQDGCDSTVTLTLNVNPVFNTTDVATICDGESFQFGTQSLTTAGNYTEVFASQDGCDSTVTLTLNVNPVFNTTDVATICDGESLQFGNLTLTTAGTYTQVFASEDGCDSTVSLTLNVNPVFNDTDVATICEGESLQFGTQTLTEAGIYTETFTSEDGCDSTVVLTLNVNPTDSTFLNELTCDINQVGTSVTTLPNADGCDSVITTVTVLDTIAPSVSCQDVSIVLNAQGSATLTAAEVDAGSTDNCNIASVTLSQSSFSCFDVGVVPVTLTVTDDAGNSASCTANVTVTASDPLACLSLKLEGDSLIGVNGNNIVVPFTVEDFNTITGGQGSVNWDPSVLAFDAARTNSTITSLLINNTSAGQATFSFFDSGLAGFNLSDGDTLFELEFEVLGAQGSSTAVALTNTPIVQEYFRAPINPINFELVNGFVDVPFDVSLSGEAKTEDGTSIPGVTFSLSGYNGPQSQTGNPAYDFLVTPGTQAEVGAYKNNDIDRDNGVSVLDILLTSLDITGIQSLTSPYKKIAADVNYSGNLNSIDLLLMQFFIVQVNPGFPDPFSPPAIDRLWTFLPSDYVFADPSDPVPFDTSRVYNFVLGGSDQDFIGVKLGDVDNSWNSAIPRTKAKDPIYFEMDDLQVQKGQEFVMPVKVRDFDEIAGYQYTLEWNADELELIGVDQSALQGTFGMSGIEEGYLTVLWNEPAVQGVELQDGTSIFSLRFRAKGQNGKLSTIDFSGDVIPMEAYTGQLKARSIVGTKANVQIGQITTSTDISNELSYSLSPQPNPFTQSMILNISIPQRSDVNIEIINNLGQVIKGFQESFDAGKHQIEWDGLSANGEVIPAGIYYVRMLTSDHQQVISIRKKH